MADRVTPILDLDNRQQICESTGPDKEQQAANPLSVVGDLWEMADQPRLLAYLDQYEGISQPPSLHQMSIPEWRLNSPSEHGLGAIHLLRKVTRWEAVFSTLNRVMRVM